MKTNQPHYGRQSSMLHRAGVIAPFVFERGHNTLMPEAKQPWHQRIWRRIKAACKK